MLTGPEDDEYRVLGRLDRRLSAWSAGLSWCAQLQKSRGREKRVISVELFGTAALSGCIDSGFQSASKSVSPFRIRARGIWFSLRITF